MSYAYYPGCAALRSTTGLDIATQRVAARLDIAWTTLDNAACCGSRECGGLGIQDDDLKLAINARTMALAERSEAQKIVTVCSTCQLELAHDNHRLTTDPEIRRRANRALTEIGLGYQGQVEIKHLLYVLTEDIGLQQLSKAVTRPLKGLRVAPFYGCHLLRPAALHGSRDDPYKPHSLGDLIQALGGEEVQYSGATKCCGFHSLLVREMTALRMTGKHLQEAQEKGADLVVTPCPLCHTVLDSYQPRAAAVLGISLHLPVLHLPQLVGLALGFSSKDLGMDRQVVKMNI